MKRFGLALLLFALSMPAFAGTEILLEQSDKTHRKWGGDGDAGYMILRDLLVSLLGCDDEANGVCLVESRYMRTKVTGDASVKPAPGYVEKISCYPNDSAPTAGTIVLYDNTAESGTELWRFEVTTSYFTDVKEDIHAFASTGIYVGYTTTNDVNCWVNWR